MLVNPGALIKEHQKKPLPLGTEKKLLDITFVLDRFSQRLGGKEIPNPKLIVFECEGHAATIRTEFGRDDAAFLERELGHDPAGVQVPNSKVPLIHDVARDPEIENASLLVPPGPEKSGWVRQLRLVNAR